MKKVTLSLVALLLCLCIQAQHRSEQEAIQIAQEFFAKKQMKKAPRLSVVPQQKVSQQIQRKVASAKKAPAKNSSCYIINDEENNRFVIVAADERLYKILGYSDNGMFYEDMAADGLLFLLDGYDNQYEALIEGKIKIGEKTAQNELFQPVEPFIETEWGQGYPYIDRCPQDPEFGGNCVTGCVATAMAQVMKYYNWPKQGKGSIDYKSSPYGFKISEKFSNYQFDWTNMPNKYDGEWSDEQISAVSQLMYACGISVAMNYTNSDSGSVANPGNIAYAMINFFDYNPNIKFYDRDYFTKQQWDSIIKQDIRNHRPVLYGGKSGINGGHRFVLDGYDNQGLYHVNWGWYGKHNNDGYFELSALTPGEYDFSLEQTMVCNITPEKEAITKDIDFYALEFLPKEYNSPIEVGKQTNATFRELKCCGSSYHSGSHFQGNIGIGVFDMDNKYVKSLSRFSIDTYTGLENMDYISCTYSYDASTFSDGSKYYIAPYSYNSKTKTLKPIHTKGDASVVFLATVTNGKVVLSNDNIKPVVKEGLVGTFNVKALGKGGKVTDWQTTITKATNDNNKYLFTNLDPVLDDYTVVGFMNEVGNYEIPLDGQDLGEGRSLYSSSSSIIIRINEDSTMVINDTWGTQICKGTGKNISIESLSQYERTEYRYPSVQKTIEKPVIVVDENHVMTISCATEDVEIRYTLSGMGAEPTEQSTLYTSSKTLSENAIIEAKAFKNGNTSETTVLSYTGFVVEKPEISASGHTISITCSTPQSTIYYTLDGSEPTKNSYKYAGEGFVCDTTTTIKAIAVRNNWNDSPISVYQHVVIPVPDLVIANNIAGNLPSQITEEQKLNATSLTISGQLNGTDIKFIREMLADGKLAYLDMGQASIVEGGESYYLGYVTENDVIGSYMFSDSNNLLSISLPNTARKIDVAAISRFGMLKELSLPSLCEVLVYGAIRDCDKLEKVCLPESIKEFSGYNFDGCPNLKYIDIDDANPYYISVDGIVFSKNMSILVKYPAGLSNRSYIIPMSVNTIGEYAFRESLLEEIYLPTQLSNIDSSAFAWCNQLKKIVIPNSVTQLGNSAFSCCKNLSSVTLSKNIERIEDYTFSGCVSLTVIIIGKNTKIIKGSAFDGCSSLRKFIVNEDNEWYCANDGILYSKDMNELVRCPEGLYRDEYLIPDGVEVIGDNAFYGCKNIEKFTLPQSLTEIGISSFTFCGMSSIYIPSKVVKIGSNAFSNCNNLESFIFPDSIKDISDYVLSNCDKLSYVYIPTEGGVNTIGYCAFAWCESLSVIKCEILNIDSVEVGMLAFENIPDTCTWIVHCKPNNVDKGISDMSLIDLYKAQSWWNPNWRIIQEICDGIDIVSINTNTLQFKNGKPFVTADQDGAIRVFTLDGLMLQNINAKKGEQYQIDLPRGKYIVNNKKVLVQ